MYLYHEHKPLFNFLNDVKNHIRIPFFAHSFHWSRKQRIDLIDSIYRGYPIGNITLWVTGKESSSVQPSIGPYPLGLPTESHLMFVLLDGVQRVTTLACLFSKFLGEETYPDWDMYFNVQNGGSFEYLSPGEIPQIYHFPVRDFTESLLVLRKMRKIEQSSSPNKKDWISSLESMGNTLFRYSVSTANIRTSSPKIPKVFSRLHQEQK